jgi:hypothetical protein
MTSFRRFLAGPFLLSALAMGCKQRPSTAASAQQPAPRVASTATAQPQGLPAQRELPSPNVQPTTPPNRQPSAQVPPNSAGGPQLEDIEERKGPFSFGGQTFTVVLHSKRMPGLIEDSAQTLASLDIVDAAGAIRHHEEFPHAIENGEFSDTCSVSINPIKGSNGAGLLLDTGCLPSAPLSGGPWQIFGIVNGKLAPIGKPLYTEGGMGDFVPGQINHIGNLTQILPDELRIRVFTGYFFVSVPVMVNWMEGKLALGQHCFYQTGHGAAEGGCEMPVEGVEAHRDGQDVTFVRMFSESTEQTGAPAHVVIQRNSRVEVLAAKVLIKWDEGKDSIGLGVGDDIWVKIRVDSKEGWIHTDEDLQSIGLYRSG